MALSDYKYRSIYYLINTTRHKKISYYGYIMRSDADRNIIAAADDIVRRR